MLFWSIVQAMTSPTPEELRRWGQALFGEHWQADLTSALGLGDSSRLRAMLAGRRRIPQTLPLQLRRIAMLRREALDGLLRETEAFADRTQNG